MEGTGTGAPAQAPAPAGQAQSGAAPVSNSPDAGQGGAPAPAPVAGQASKAPESGKGDVAQKPNWDGDTMRWMSSKGYDHSAYDPGNESHAKLIKQTRELERIETKRQQEKATQESFEKAKRLTEKPKNTDAKSPLDAFEDSYKNEVLTAMRVLGCTTAKDLAVKNPELYKELESSYVIKRQQAWEQNQQWAKEQELAQQEEENLKRQYQEDFDSARKISTEKLKALEAKHPDLKANFAKYGVNALTDALAEKYSVYPEMLFLDDRIAGFFADAADAIAYRNAEPDRQKKWREDYERERIEMAKSVGPRPAGSTQSIPVHSTGSGWDTTLAKHSKKLITK